ncbi:GDT1-like protein 1, chloroplastic isoform X3 [Amaranthus tricolor]|uniref:GDT1-like protein 1, chloroplastic isoform X3 n=1 Tax=Amaranthus tricolor TaxID=29722 RepID=UPI002583EBAD|nr:GDT1-like protein 1, chloroplastic isoform X3 [Amaranthus tricolor]
MMLSTSPQTLFGCFTASNYGGRLFDYSLTSFSLRRRIPCALQSRALSKRYNSMREEDFRLFAQKVWEGSSKLERRPDENDNQLKAANMLKDVHDFGASYPSTLNMCRADDIVAAMDTSSLDKRTQQLLKFVFLFGILTFQGVQNASATSSFMDNLQSDNFFGDLSDISTGFTSAFLLIFFSELGDKTFFIAALLAARNSAAIVFTGTFGALAIMTIISVILGRTFHYIDGVIPFSFGGSDLPIDDIAAVCLLVYFGVTTLIDATSSDSQKAEDEQKEAELAVSDFSGNGAGILAAASTIASTFVLVFVAEWGDKSFFSTIALAAASSPLGVIGGALAGHGVATLLAVAGGSLLGTFLSEKVISYVGGVLFLVFAGITLVEIIQER